MATPLVGHLDPQFLALMNEVQEMLRYLFQTENELTIRCLRHRQRRHGSRPVQPY